jgi:hypothetical protein
MNICICTKEILQGAYRYSIANDESRVVYSGTMICGSAIEATIRTVNLSVKIFDRRLCLYTFSKYLYDLILSQKNVDSSCSQMNKRRGQRIELSRVMDELFGNMDSVISCELVNRHNPSSKCKVALQCIDSDYIREKGWRVDRDDG